MKSLMNQVIIDNFVICINPSNIQIKNAAIEKSAAKERSHSCVVTINQKGFHWVV